MGVDLFTESLRVAIFVMSVLVLLALILWVIVSIVTAIQKRRRTKAWWTSRPDLKDWFNDQ